MWGVVELSDYVVPVIWTCKTVFVVCLWAEVPKNQHSRMIMTHED